VMPAFVLDALPYESFVSLRTEGAHRERTRGEIATAEADSTRASSVVNVSSESIDPRASAASVCIFYCDSIFERASKASKSRQRSILHRSMLLRCELNLSLSLSLIRFMNQHSRIKSTRARCNYVCILILSGVIFHACLP